MRKRIYSRDDILLFLEMPHFADLILKMGHFKDKIILKVVHLREKSDQV